MAPRTLPGTKREDRAVMAEREGGDPACWAHLADGEDAVEKAVPLPLISASQLAAVLGGDRPVKVADVRWDLVAGPLVADHEAGHVPGAVFVSLDTDLAGPASPAAGRHPLPDPATFAATRTRLGFADGVHVVVYDGVGGIHAARLWWMLTALGVRASVLDGGFPAWATDRARPVETGPVVPRPVDPPVAARPWPVDQVVELPEIEALAAGGRSTVLLDARAAARFRGEVVAIDPRPGHIPGAVSAETAANLAVDGRFLAPDRLHQRYAALGADGGDVVVSCGSGVTACHDALAMVVAGLPRPRLYVGSFSQWAADPERPVVTEG